VSNRFCRTALEDFVRGVVRNSIRNLELWDTEQWILFPVAICWQLPLPGGF
jgi:hypothetical protein